MEEEQQRTLMHYITAYNNFDIAGMAEHLDENIVFENISNGQKNLRTDGLTAFIEQAEMAKNYFKQREQSVTSWAFEKDKVTVDIAYKGILNVDLPNGLKVGETLILQGQSEFEFLEGRIISIRDIS